MVARVTSKIILKIYDLFRKHQIAIFFEILKNLMSDMAFLGCLKNNFIVVIKSHKHYLKIVPKNYF